MFRTFFFAALEMIPWLLRVTRIVATEGDDGDNRGSLDPNG